MIISVPSNARSLVHLDSEHLSYRSTQQIFLKQSLKSFCQITVVRFSSFFWQLTCINLLNLEAFFLLMKPFIQKTGQYPVFMFIDKRTIVFDFPLRYFSFIDFLDFACIKYDYHQISVCFNYAFSKVFFHSQSLFYWKILIAIKTAEVCQCCWGVVYVSLLKKLF